MVIAVAALALARCGDDRSRRAGRVDALKGPISSVVDVVVQADQHYQADRFGATHGLVEIRLRASTPPRTS